MHIWTSPKTKEKEYHLKTYASWTDVLMLGHQLEGGRIKIGFNTDARHNLKFHTRKQDQIETGETIEIRPIQLIHSGTHAHLKWLAGQQDPRENT